MFFMNSPTICTDLVIKTGSLWSENCDRAGGKRGDRRLLKMSHIV